MTLAGYVAAVAAALACHEGPVTMIAHSMGGIPATLAAEQAPDRIAALLYVAALMPKSGETLATRLEDPPPGGLAACLKPVEGGAALAIEPADAIRLLFHDCEPGVARAASRRLTPQPTAPLAQPASPSGGYIPTGYIVTSDDRVLNAEQQRMLALQRPYTVVAEIDGGHSPFLAAPDRFADQLLALERQVRETARQWGRSGRNNIEVRIGRLE